MHAVIFELTPAVDCEERFLEIAGEIGGLLEKQEGFISMDLLTSLIEDDKRLSLSFWESEAAIEKWRNRMEHRDGQGEGKNTLFDSYRVRVAEIVRDYSKTDRKQAPTDSNKALTSQ